LVTTIIALAGFVTAGALPAAATASPVQYVALGDSYAAGVGAKSVPPQPQPCGRANSGYPEGVSGSESRIDLAANVACSGATTSDVATQLSALKPDTRLVTLTVGAANLGLSAVLAACTAQPPTPGDCAARIADANRELGDCGGLSPLGGKLIALYRKVADAAPGARIVVTGYPLLFTAPPGFPQTAINDATAELNCVIERAVAAAKDDVNIYYVDVTEEFTGHGIGCSDANNSTSCLFINPPEVGLPEAFHPTDAGYKAYAEAIKTKLPNGWLDKPSP